MTAKRKAIIRALMKFLLKNNAHFEANFRMEYVQPYEGIIVIANATTLNENVLIMLQRKISASFTPFCPNLPKTAASLSQFERVQHFS